MAARIIGNIAGYPGVQAGEEQTAIIKLLLSEAVIELVRFNLQRFGIFFN